MEIEWEILNKILDYRKRTRSTKFVGAMTIELLRKDLMELGLNVSNRDIFIEGVPNELDLLVAKKGTNPEENLVYRPDDILAVLEVKFRGSYGKSSVVKIKKVFDSIKAANKSIECYYVSVSENRRYKHRITRDNLGYQCFEFFTRESNLESALRNGRIAPTGDWERLRSKLLDL
jgi:hypothetical protein